ncbi:MAG: CoA-binding protein [Candidatus Sericytochromatia bacterium]
MAFVNSPFEPLLKNAKRIAVVGVSDKPFRDSHRIARYLQQAGFDMLPVNPLLSEVLGQKVYASLAEIPEPVDIVNVFRRSEEVPDLVEQAIAAGAKAIWLQLGVIHEAAAEKARAAGLAVVMDRCIMVDHARLLR